MEIESTLTRKTYAKLMLALILRSSSFYFMIAIIFAFFLASFLAKSLGTYWIVILTVTILYYALWLLYQCFLSKNSKYLFTKKHFTFRDENILVKFLTFEQVIKWEAFSEWRVVAGWYFLGNMFVIPRAGIPANEIQNFENLLKEKNRQDCNNKANRRKLGFRQNYNFRTASKRNRISVV